MPDVHTPARRPHHAPHAALLAEYERLTTHAPKVAQEVLHYALSQEGREAISLLAGEAAPASETKLEGARQHLENVNAQLRLAHQWRKPPTFRVPRRTSPITLNARLNDEGWHGALVLPIRFPCNVPDPVTAHATARLVWDEECVYVGFRVNKPEIYAPQIPRNGPICTFDCVEVFLMPQPKSKAYWEYNISPSSCVFEAYLSKNHDRPYSSRQPRQDMAGLRTAINTNPPPQNGTHEPGYIVEMAVPWTELPGMRHAPKAGDTVHGLFAMSYLTGPRESCRTFVAHIPTVASFHNITCYSPFELAD